MRSLFLYSFVGVFVFLSVFGLQVLAQEPEEINSVELGLAETSPNGHEGGYAVPASGCSAANSCSLSVSQQCVNATTVRATITVNLGNRFTGNRNTLYLNGRAIYSAGERPRISRTINVAHDRPHSGYVRSCGSSGCHNMLFSFIAQSCTPPPTAQIFVKKTTVTTWTGSNIAINPGEQVQLHWKSTNATRCVGTNYSTGNKVSGVTGNVSEPTAGTSRGYRVTCYGPGGSATDALAVTMGAAPKASCSISASPSTVPASGGYVTFSWSASNANGASLWGAGSPPNPFSGGSGSYRMRVSPKTQVLQVWGPGGNGSCQVTVGEGQPEEPVQSYLRLRGCSYEEDRDKRNDCVNGERPVEEAVSERERERRRERVTLNMNTAEGEILKLNWDARYVRDCNSAGTFVIPPDAGDERGRVTPGYTEVDNLQVAAPALGSSKRYRVTCESTVETYNNGDPYYLVEEIIVNNGDVVAEEPEISCDEAIVRSGDDVTCEWDTNGADPASCTLAGPGLNQSSLASESGSETITINSESTFTIECPTGEDEVTVEVLPVIQET